MVTISTTLLLSKLQAEKNTLGTTLI